MTGTELIDSEGRENMKQEEIDQWQDSLKTKRYSCNSSVEA
jgi:hypothetical protein